MVVLDVNFHMNLLSEGLQKILLRSLEQIDDNVNLPFRIDRNRIGCGTWNYKSKLSYLNLLLFTEKQLTIFLLFDRRGRLLQLLASV